MNTNIRAQIAAILAVLVLTVITLAPWLAGSHWLKPQAIKWNKIITHKDELLQQLSDLDKEVVSYQNMPEKKAAVTMLKKNIDQTGIDSIQGFVNSGKYQIVNFKVTQVGDTKEARFSLVAGFNDVGQVLSDMWNNFQFLETASLIMKPNPNRPDDEVVVTVAVRLP